MKKLVRNIKITHILLLIGYTFGALITGLLGTVYFILFCMCMPFVKLISFCMWIYNGDTINVDRWKILNIIDVIETWVSSQIDKNLNRLPECNKCMYYKTYNPGGGPYHYTFCGHPNREDQDFPLKQQLISDPGFRLKCFKCRD